MKMSPLLAIATLFVAGSAGAQTGLPPAAEPARPTDARQTQRVQFAASESGEIAIGVSHGRPFSALICNIERSIAGSVYVRRIPRQDWAIRPGSCLFVNDVIEVGTATGRSWQGYAFFYF
jgi:hypothetical protein